jgi:predicted aldo/keto reductase-like oxidoreductase
MRYVCFNPKNKKDGVNMQYRPDKFQRDLSILGFGCMRFPRSRGRIDMAKSEALVLDAVARGVNYFDTAYVYPGSEEAVGHIVAKNGLRSKIYLATKLPLFLCKSYADFDKFFNKSLERLQTGYVDYYLMHMITTPEQWRSLCGMGIEKWFEEKKARGAIRQLGFSFHGRREDFTGIVDARDWDFCLIQYNYLDINNQAGRTGLVRAASKGIPVFVMEPLLGGRLANRKSLPVKALQTMSAADPSLSPAAWALRWVWNHKEVTLLLSGMSSQAQLDENIAVAERVAAPGFLSESELVVIDRVIAAANESNRIPCTGCGYCIPCPVGVNIPGCFASYNDSYRVGRFAALKPYAMATSALTTKSGLASACKSCGKCEAHCPQGIKIIDALRKAARRLEPFWFTAGVSAARWFTGFKAKKGR